MKHFAFACLGVALLASCRKDDMIICGPPVPAIQPTPTVPFADLRAASPAVQTFAFDLGQAQSLRTRGGASLAFGAGVFLLPNGTVATGQAELQVREIYTVADMILANLPTSTSSRQMLISGGEFNIQVWQGTSRLRMAGSSPQMPQVPPRLTLTSPVPMAGLDTTQMMLWRRASPVGAGTAADTSGWQLNGTRVPPTAGFFKAALPLDSIANWNLDQFWHAYQTSPRTVVGVDVPAGGNSYTNVFFRPVGFNALARTYVGSSAPTRWQCTLPMGADVVAVVLQQRDGQLYFGTQRITVQPNSTVTPTLQALTAADIVQRIRQL
ncbi:hypothetical protein AUC43_11640 [Hymenobacter sedentarius]|uniref:Uncharacterized protein n=1 Tax=Hymenobacter sedentarius TaxID=1411621 RepID=A0A0U4C3S0_9BACT|nr:hypothetical protein [Hymenobacter sedentarius]ALW85682.1 hypothetical protein AUC43_11640 [Hymenobacter sedentarius]